MKIAYAAMLVLALSACDPQPEGEPVTRARIDGKAGSPTATEPTPATTVATQVESACRSIIFEDTPLTHCLAIPARHRVTMEFGPDGEPPYRSLTALAAGRDASEVAFAINAGMFGDEGEPVGYFVEDSNRLRPLDTSEGEGNFYMKPNGVFFGSGDVWEIRTTEDFLANVTERPEFGTQSGPMLVVDGKIHPEITADGPSRLIRNAVGVDEKGRAHFVISNAPLSFGKLARFFRNELDVKNALYLDDTVSALWNPSTDRLDSGAPIGPIIVIERKADSE